MTWDVLLVQVSKAIRGEKEEEEAEPDSSAENGETKILELEEELR